MWDSPGIFCRVYPVAGCTSFSSFWPGSKGSGRWGGVGGNVPFPFHATATFYDLQKGFSWTQRNWILFHAKHFQDPISQRGDLSKLYPNAPWWRTANYTRVPTKGMPHSCLK